MRWLTPSPTFSSGPLFVPMRLPTPLVQATHRVRSLLTRVCATAVAVGVMAFGSDANAQARNLALNRPTVTSSAQEGITGNYAVDGDGGTRWGSLFTANEWIYVDLGASTTISRVVLTWETAYAIGYKVQTSPDAANWTDIRTITDGDGGVDDLTVSGTGRYIRILGTVRGAVDYGYSLWEFAVYSGTTATGDLAKNRPATA